MLLCYQDIMSTCKRNQEAKLREKRTKQALFDQLMDKVESMPPCTCEGGGGDSKEKEKDSTYFNSAAAAAIASYRELTFYRSVFSSYR